MKKITTKKGFFSSLVFGKTQLPQEAIIFAGMLYPEKELENILGTFEKTTKRSDFQPVLAYEATRRGKTVLLCFCVYGGTNALELTNLLADGGVKRITFIGWAGARGSRPIGSVVIPSEVRSLDGIVNLDEPRMKLVKATPQELATLKKLFPSAHAVSHATLPGLGGLHGIRNVEKQAKKYDTIDTELAVVLHFAKKNKMRAAGILIITDNEAQHSNTINTEATFVRQDRYAILRAIVAQVTSS